MAIVFQNRTTNYSGDASPITGTGIVKISFNPGTPGESKLMIMTRVDGYDVPFVPKRFPGWKTSNGIPYLDVADTFGFNAEGIEYYYVWEKGKTPLQGGDIDMPISATLVDSNA